MVKHQKVSKYYEMIAGTKFQLKVAISNFWAEFVQKGYYRSKLEKENIAIEF